MVLIGIDPYPYINHKIVMALSSRCANHRPQKVAPSWAASRSKTSPRPKHAGIPKNSSIATSCYTALVKNCLARLKKKTDAIMTSNKTLRDFEKTACKLGKEKLARTFETFQSAAPLICLRFKSHAVSIGPILPGVTTSVAHPLTVSDYL